MKNIIFLDIDGPLNTHDHYIKQVNDNDGRNDINFQFNFCPISLENLRQIVEATDADIVISSTWRSSANVPYDHPLRRYWKAILRNLGKVNLHRRVMGITPLLPGDVMREDEIFAWLRKHKSTINNIPFNLLNNTYNFVILDDDNDMGILSDHLVQCGLDGITDEVRDKAIAILQKK